MRYYTTFFLLFINVAGYGQTLTGYVYDSLTGKPLSPVTVVNQTTNLFAFSDEQGRYSIVARTGEQVGFSFIGYKSTSRTMPIGLGNQVMRVGMRPANVQLKEFTLRPGHLSQFQIDSIERRQTYKLQLQRERASIGSPASAIAEAFSKRAKSIYKFQKHFAETESQRFTDTRYTPDLVSSVTGLKGDTVGFFMNSYPMPGDYARSASDLELKMWIRTNYKTWIKDTARRFIPVIKESGADTLKR